MRDGEVPYQANRRAVDELCIKWEAEDGVQELMVMLEGLDVFIGDLEEIKSVLDKTAKQTTAAI